ncbi:MAG: DNA-binding protein [Geobacteraceae bacterium GWC2_58_44]|nr:MAG: DNA-binding protein [Geobacteraceae bacterium GWC2_58_44]HBG05894.1 DNA-binding protein [Geobacter sp.]
MKRYSTIMSVLLTLALPVAASCAEVPKAPEKADAPVEAKKEAAPKGAPSKKADAGTTTTKGADLSPSGKVVETMDGGGYTYANLEKDGKKTWVAFPTLETRVGETLSFSNCMEMPGFQSKALKRKFDTILFCGSPQIKPKTAIATAGKKQNGSKAAAKPAGQVKKMDKASGANAYTVEEIFAKRAALNGKHVVVKGQVVKVSSGIMGKNWIHLQDGSGSEKQKNNDLVVTSANEEPEVGAVVTMSGTLAKDKDFGGGYKYNAIIEKGSVKK